MSTPPRDPLVTASPESRKRKLSMSASADASGRVFKHRSSKACKACRARKVRCDVLTSGVRCTNCRLDDTECVVLESRRGKHKRGPRTRSDDNQGSGTSAVVPPAKTNKNRRSAGAVEESAKNDMPQPPAPLRMSSSNSDVPVCVTFDEEPPSDDAMSDNGGQSKRRSANSSAGPVGPQELLTPEEWSFKRPDHLLQSKSNAANQQSPCNKFPLPPWISPFSEDLPLEDMEFLAQKGAFEMPDLELRAEILRCYTFSVHPFMPMLDIQLMARAALGQQEGPQVSLLLFQAVMFAGLASLELRFVQRLGFDSTKEAREVFFSRVRLLYELDVEQDEAPLFQSLLLMSWWYGRWNRRRHTWHWTGLAHSVALNMGLQREPTHSCGSEKTRRFRRRLWWSLYIRDRMLALGTRRPMRIRDEEFDVAMLTLEDFDVQPPIELNHGHPAMPDAEENAYTALMCIELAKLSVCIGHVLSSHYTTLSTEPNLAHTTMIVPKFNGDRTDQELEKCDSEIDEWFKALKPNLQKFGSNASRYAANSCSEIHWTFLNMLHLTLVNALHRTQTLQPLSTTAEVQSTQKKSRAKVKDTARNITKLTYDMLRRDQARFLGLPGVTASVAACLSHMLDIRSSDEDIRDASIFRFYQTMQVLQSLATIYASADSAVSFIMSVIRKARISLPEQVTSPSADFTGTKILRSSSLHDSPSTEMEQSVTSESLQAANWRQTDGQAANSSSTSHPYQIYKSHSLPTNTIQAPPSLGTASSSPAGTGAMMHAAPQQQPQQQQQHPQPNNVNFPGSIPSLVNSSLTTPTRDGSAAYLLPQQFMSSPSGADTQQLPNLNGPFMAWSNGVDPGVDQDAIDFNYDFYRDVFGCADGQPF